VHDLGHRAYPEAHTRAQRWYLELSARWHVRSAEHLIADSEATRRDLANLYGADPDRITVAHLGVDSSLREATDSAVAAARLATGLPDESRYVLHVGTVQPRKNLPRLVEAFALVAADVPDLYLVLAGGVGWGGDEPMAHARRLGIDSRVRQTGYVDRASLPALYTGSLATIVPSLHEGFGLPVLEAMACGAPVAASGVSSIPEVAGDAALLFDPLSVEECSAAIRRLATDRELRDRLSRAGKVRASRFTWRRCADTIRGVLETVAAGKLSVR
jgi:glycosyltransferase involved in cell wall biosynthesis